MFKTLITGLLLAAMALPAQPIANLTTEEADRLTFMREEEKLARDVYLFLAEKWKLRVFANIAQSEETHFRQIGVLLQRYGVADPAAGRGRGEFQNASLANLYAELTQRGALSVQEALEVGVLIEKVDIADLEAALTIVKPLDIRRVFRNLLNASDNHLDAFEGVLEAVKAS